MKQIDNIKEYFFKERDRWMTWIPVLFGLGIAIYFSLPTEPSKWIILSIIEILLLSAYFQRHHPERLLIIFALSVIAFGFADIQVQSLHKSKQVEKITDNEVTYLQGKIIKIDYTAYGKTRLTLNNVADYDNPRKGIYKITLNSQKNNLQEGQCVELIARLNSNFLPAMPQGYQYDRAAFFEGQSGIGFAESNVYTVTCQYPSAKSDDIRLFIRTLRKNITARIHKQLSPDEAGIAAAIIAGERSGISPEITQNYRNAGLAHFLSISGLHMGIIATLAFFVLRLLLSLIPAYSAKYNSRKAAAVFAIIISFIYLLISGAYVSTQRAFIMTFVVLLGILFDRQAISMRMVSIAALIILIISPEALVGAGFQMSFAAVIALIAFYERYALSLHRFFAGKNIFKLITAYIVGLLISDFIAGIATLPFSIYHFNQIALYTSLGNLLAGPIIGLIIMPFILLSLLTIPFGLESIPLKITGFGIGLINDITAWVAHLPQAGLKIPAMPLWGLTAIIIGGLWICLWQQKWRRWGLIPIMIGIISLFFTTRPDVLYDTDIKTVAFQDQNGNMIIMPRRGKNRIKQIWLEKTMSPALTDEKNTLLKQIYIGKTEAPDWLEIKCSQTECIYKNILVWDKRGMIFKDNKPLTSPQDGGGSIFISGKNIQLKTVCDSVGNRLWNSCGKSQ